jgi:hypothetical protein
MLLRIALTGFGLSAIFLASCSGGGSSGPTSPAPTPSPSPTLASATITKSASTNTQGYTITLLSSGAATITVGSNPATSGTASSSVTSQFFGDLNANTPVADITTYGPCTKSASFGSTTTVTYAGYTTGDISCPAPSSPAPVTTIYTDVQNVETSLGLMGPTPTPT